MSHLSNKASGLGESTPGTYSRDERAHIESEWIPDADGFPRRRAARIVIADSDDRLYLILGHDISDPDHRWWFTVGGGVAPDEDLRAGAARELEEETGLSVDPNRLVGPVLRRHATFYFVAETRKQDEDFFLLRVTDSERDLIDSRTGARLTQLEQDLLDEFSWWSIEDLAHLESRGQAVYPRGLPEMARSWLSGWDGVMKEVTEA